MRVRLAVRLAVGLAVGLAVLASFACLLPAASGQAAPVLSIDAVAVESSPLDPGNATAVHVTLTRVCPNAALVYPETAAEVAVRPRDGNWTVDGPLQAAFPQHVCAQGSRQSIVVSYVVTAPRDAERGETFPFIAKGRLHPANQVTPASNEAQFPFAIATTEAPPVQPAAEEVVRESPAAAGLPLLGLAAAVRLARRR